MRNNIEGFKYCKLAMSVPQIDVMESRMALRGYVIQADDLLNCKKFGDFIATGAYEVDIHNPDGLRAIITQYHAVHCYQKTKPTS